VVWAQELARQHLADALPGRWVHVQAVAARVSSLGGVVPGDRELVIAAGWLHDLGYAPALVDSGFHALDGARYLRRLGADDRLCRLVAHHSAALVEANERGLAGRLRREFPQEHSAVADVLCYADLTTGPDGELVTVEGRLAEIVARYGPGHIVSDSVERAKPDLLAAARRTRQRLAEAAVRSR
jgi:HD superfamily phosphodiesterase